MNRKVVLFEDEAGFSLHPKLGRVWALKGTQPWVWTESRHQKRLNLFGWVDPVHGWHGMMKWPQGNTEGFLKLLGRICRRFKGYLVDLWADRAGWHRGPQVRRFLSLHRQIRLHYIPAYHPKLNFQERLWKKIRYEETTNVYFEDMETLENSVMIRSQIWKPASIKRLCQLI